MFRYNNLRLGTGVPRACYVHPPGRFGTRFFHLSPRTVIVIKTLLKKNYIKAVKKPRRTGVRMLSFFFFFTYYDNRDDVVYSCTRLFAVMISCRPRITVPRVNRTLQTKIKEMLKNEHLLREKNQFQSVSYNDRCAYLVYILGNRIFD